MHAINGANIGIEQCLEYSYGGEYALAPFLINLSIFGPSDLQEHPQ